MIKSLQGLLLVSSVLVVTSTVTTEVPSLTTSNWDALTDGKTLFIKFFAPWCGHCQAMKEDWEKLASEYADNDTALIAEIDCTSDEGQRLCEENEVRGFPTLKYGDPSNLEKYPNRKGRDYNSLKEFADEYLKPLCSPRNLHLCSDEKTVEITKYIEMAKEGKLDDAIAEEAKRIEDAEKSFQEENDRLTKEYEDSKIERDETIAMIKAEGLNLMKAVRAARERDEKRNEL